jgi:hypothetical protein
MKESFLPQKYYFSVVQEVKQESSFSTTSSLSAAVVLVSDIHELSQCCKNIQQV